MKEHRSLRTSLSPEAGRNAPAGHLLPALDGFQRELALAHSEADLVHACLKASCLVSQSPYAAMGLVKAEQRVVVSALGPGGSMGQRVLEASPSASGWGAMSGTLSGASSLPDPCSLELPKGYPAVRLGLLVPLAEDKGCPLGALLVANRSRPYSAKHQSALELLARLFGESLMRYRAEAALRLTEARLEAVFRLQQMGNAPLEQIAEFALEEAVRLTASRIGYLAFVNDEQTTLTMYTWSKAAIEQCETLDRPMAYSLEDTGLWGEAVRQRRPIITNDYQAPHPWKKGLPSGHVPIVRHMNLPVFDGTKIKLVAGVGNKDEDYNESDVRQLSLLMQSMWTLLGRKQESLRDAQRFEEQEERYSQLLSAVTSYTYSVELRSGQAIATRHSSGCVAVSGYSPQDYEADPYLWIRMVAPEDRERVRRHVAAVLAGQAVAPLEHRLQHRDGALHWVRSTIVHRRDRGGSPVGYDGLVEDITAQKNAEQELHGREAELFAARKIQERLLPRESPPVAGFEIAGRWSPAEIAAGDYYDYLSMSDGSLGLAIGDVAGHRFGSALVMAAMQAYLRSLVQSHCGVGEILELANQTLLGEIEEDYFVTLLLARLNPRTRCLLYASAGHETGYVLDPSGEIKTRLESSGFPLGLFSEADFGSGQPVTLESGDLVLLLTDGIREARSSGNVSFGTARVLETVRGCRELSAGKIAARLFDTVHEFSGEGRQMDDMTAVVVKVP